MCPTLALDSERTSLYTLDTSPVGKRGTPGVMVPQLWELLTASEAHLLNQVLEGRSGVCQAGKG